MVRVLLVHIALGVVATASARAAVEPANRTDPEAIRAAAERYVGNLGTPGTVVHATAGRLDPRLALAPCAGDLTPSLPPGSTVKPRTTVTVRCDGTNAWSIYVPVTVESDAQVLVARRSLARGELPTASDFSLERRRVPGLAAAFSASPADVGSRRLRRPVAAGEILAAEALAPAVLVQRGQQVTVVAEASGIAVRASAVALANGSVGDRVRVQNPASQRVVEGVVQPDGTVAAAP